MQSNPELGAGLTKCRHCGIEVSTFVNKCPGCGQPIREKVSKNRWQPVLLMLAAAIAFIVLIVVVIKSKT